MTLRTLYRWYVLAFAVMVWGFWPDAYGGNGPVDALRWLHGLLAAGWMALLVAQSWLIGHGQPRLHAQAGRLSRLAVPVLVASAFLVVRSSIGPQSHFGPRLRLTLGWLDLWSLVLFSGLYLTAYAYRRNMVVHSRAMAGTLFAVLPVPIGRGLGRWLDGLSAALPPAYWSVDALLLVVIARDTWRGRFTWPLPITLGATLLMQATMFHAADLAPFVAFARLIATG